MPSIAGNIPALFDKHSIDLHAAGVASSFKDVFAIRKYDPPQLDVCEP